MAKVTITQRHAPLCYQFYSTSIALHDQSNLFLLFPLLILITEKSTKNTTNNNTTNTTNNNHNAAKNNTTTPQQHQDNFTEVVRNQEFCLLSAEDLKVLLSSDDICVSSEVLVFEALITWTSYKEEERKQDLMKLLPYVRLPLLPPQVAVSWMLVECLCHI